MNDLVLNYSEYSGRLQAGQEVTRNIRAKAREGRSSVDSNANNLVFGDISYDNGDSGARAGALRRSSDGVRPEVVLNDGRLEGKKKICFFE